MNYKSAFLKLTGAAALAQILSAAFIPAISRIYTPEEFAAFAFWATIGGLVGGVLTLKQEQFLLSREVSDWPPVLARIFAIYKYVFSIFLLGFSLYLTLGLPNNGVAIFFSFLYSLSTSFIIFYSIIANVYGQFPVLSRARLFMSLMLGSIQVLLGLILNTSTSLLAGAVGSQIAFLAILYPAIRKLPLDCSFTPISLPSTQEILKTVASIWSSISLTVATSFLPVMIFSLGYQHEAGIVAMLQRFLMLPVTLLATPLSQVFVFFLRQTKLKQIESKLLLFAALSILLAYLAVYFAAHLAGHFGFFAFFLGDFWKEADTVVSLIASIYVGLLVRNVLLQYFLVKEKQAVLAKIDIFFIFLLLLFYVLTDMKHISLAGFLISLNIAYLLFALIPAIAIIRLSINERI